MVTKLLAVRIKELREEIGESQQSFAVRIGISRSYLAETESGKRNISIRNLLKIANGLGVTLEELFDSDLFDPLYPAPVDFKAAQKKPNSTSYYVTSLSKRDQS